MKVVCGEVPALLYWNRNMRMSRYSACETMFEDAVLYLFFCDVPVMFWYELVPLPKWNGVQSVDMVVTTKTLVDSTKTWVGSM